MPPKKNLTKSSATPEFSLEPDEAAIIFHADGAEGFVCDKELVEEGSPTEKAFFVLWCLTKKEYLEEFRRQVYGDIPKE